MQGAAAATAAQAEAEEAVGMSFIQLGLPVRTAIPGGPSPFFTVPQEFLTRSGKSRRLPALATGRMVLSASSSQ